MGRRLATNFISAIAAATVACAHLSSIKPSSFLQPAARAAVIERAHVWQPTDVSALDLRLGPTGEKAFAPLQTVTCDYVDNKLPGGSPKFACAITPEDVVKVKYGRDNGEVYGEVAATRLLWALGFGADRMYPVRVVCRGCPADPQRDHRRHDGTVVFDPATIERKMPGRELESRNVSGWVFPELDHVDKTAGGAPKAQRDAIKLLAVMLQHTDSKAQQQRLLCLDEHAKDEEASTCQQPFMMISDLGLTFGRANTFNRDVPGSVDLQAWAHVPVWASAKQCIGNLPKSWTGSLENPLISEAGRQFLGGLLAQLTDSQIHDLFDVARFPLRMRGNHLRSTSVDDWVSAFKKKRDQILNRSCPS